MGNERLSANFTLRELTATSSGLPNEPPAEAVAALRVLCEECLQPLRAEWGTVTVTSGYRSPSVNRAVGGVNNSQHIRGEAADIQLNSMRAAFAWMRAHLPYDQLIWEYGSNATPSWIHISHKATGDRHEVLRVYRGGRTVRI